jgi:hypothetical protein
MVTFVQFFLILSAAFVDVNPVSVEVLADEVLGAEAAKEHTLLESKLGGTRNNRVFAFFGTEAPRHVADARLAGAEGKKKTKGEPTGVAGGKPKKTSKGSGSTTGALEKKKRRGEDGGTWLKKRSCLIDTFLT